MLIKMSLSLLAVRISHRLPEFLEKLSRRCKAPVKRTRDNWEISGVAANFELFVSSCFRDISTVPYENYVGDHFSDEAIETPDLIINIDTKTIFHEDVDARKKRDGYIHLNLRPAQTSLSFSIGECKSKRSETKSKTAEFHGLVPKEVEGKPVHCWFVCFIWRYANEKFIVDCVKLIDITNTEGILWEGIKSYGSRDNLTIRVWVPQDRCIILYPVSSVLHLRIEDSTQLNDTSSPDADMLAQ